MYNFINLCIASKRNPHFVFFDVHNSHWGPAAINLNRINFVCNFFLKEVDSEKDQPNDNGPNPSLKSLHNKHKEIWCEKYGTTIFTSPHMDNILKPIWEHFKQRYAPIIVQVFHKCLLFPLHPLTKDNNMSGGAIAAVMKYAEGKKATKLSIIQTDTLTLLFSSIE